MEIAKSMSFNIAKFANSDYGVGIAGKINRIDPNNLHGEDNVVFVSIYDKELNKYYELKLIMKKSSREENKK